MESIASGSATVPLLGAALSPPPTRDRRTELLHRMDYATWGSRALPLSTVDALFAPHLEPLIAAVRVGRGYPVPNAPGLVIGGRVHSACLVSRVWDRERTLVATIGCARSDREGDHLLERNI